MISEADMARSRKGCEYCQDVWTTDFVDHRNGYCLWAEFYPSNNLIAVIAQANDEDGYMIEDHIEIPFNYCPNCGSKLI